MQRAYDLANVPEYVKRDRQWSRMLRIRHARAMWAKAGPEEKAFWNAILRLNGVMFTNKGFPLHRITSSTAYALKQAEKHEQDQTAKVTVAEVQ